LTARQDERLDKLIGAGRHLLSVINDVLDLAKIESGRVTLQEHEFALTELLAGVTDIVEGMARAKGLTLSVDMAGMPASLVGDATRLRQALLNYLGNAVKFTERGGVTLRGRVVEDTGDGYRVCFAVVDSGMGIAPGMLPQLFTPFQQADESLTRPFGGTGLGLAITKRIAGLMGGEAGVESTPGQGSTFTLTVRLRKGGAGIGVAGDGGADSPEARIRGRHRGKRVLLAEDNDLNREVAVDLLREAGLVPDLAGNGAEAVRLASEVHYALILMDVQMPVMNGLDATRAIRRLAHCSDTPIIAVTAAAFDEDRAASIAAGMSDFISKPLEPERLFAAVYQWLEGN
jgi:two-component system, sensor histidine kinase and response regulator